MLSIRGLETNTKKCLYMTDTYGVVRSRGIGLCKYNKRRKVNVLQLKCLRSFFGNGVSQMGSVRNEEVRRRAEIKWNLRVLLIKEY